MPATDAEFAAGFKRDPELFTAVYDRYFRDVYRYVAGRLDTEAADDIAAETFLVAFGQRARFDPERGGLRPWLFGIATNLVARHRRKEARHYAVDRGRRQLQQAILRPASRRGTATGRGRTRWLAAGAGLTAAAGAAAAAAITVALVPGGSHGAATPLSARQILLDAATTAAAGSTASGTYWHIKEVYVRHGPASKRVVETWRLRDGAYWILDPAGTGVWAWAKQVGFPIFPVGANTTFGQIQRLPESPAAIKAWIANTLKPIGFPASVVPGEIAITLSQLLATAPAPPAVRAAAFRALASLPNVKSLGRAGDGQVLLIGWTPFTANKVAAGPVPAGDLKVVIDMATARVDSITTSQETDTIITEGWTNQMPKVVKEPPKPK